MNSNFEYYIYCILAVIAAFFIFKKVAGCLIKIVIIAAIIGVMLLLQISVKTPNIYYNNIFIFIHKRK